MSSVILPSAPSESRPGRFGVYGGRYVPETLMAELVELERVDLSRIQTREAVPDPVEQQTQLRLVIGADRLTRRPALGALTSTVRSVITLAHYPQT